MQSYEFHKHKLDLREWPGCQKTSEAETKLYFGHQGLAMVRKGPRDDSRSDIRIQSFTQLSPARREGLS